MTAVFEAPGLFLGQNAFRLVAACFGQLGVGAVVKVVLNNLPFSCKGFFPSINNYFVSLVLSLLFGLKL